MSKDVFKDYLIHSYLYYRLSQPVISDHEFDMMCVKINKEIRQVLKKYFDSEYVEFVLENDGFPFMGLEMLEGYPQEIVEEAEGMI